jgi:TetR/AcrR family transcriptional repressor of nem operon
MISVMQIRRGRDAADCAPADLHDILPAVLMPDLSQRRRPAGRGGASLGHSQAEKAKSRERILAAAARQVREGGLESLGVAELMKAANLTHGGFYGHFPSRAALIAAALDRALESSRVNTAPQGTVDLETVVRRYLSKAHRDNPAEGCAMSTLLADAARSEDPAVRERMANQVERSFAWIAGAMGDGAAAQDAATTALCAMMGALAVARVFGDDLRSERVLDVVRRAVLDLAEEAGASCDAAVP